MFSRFFESKPKLTSSQPEMRCKAIAELETDHPKLLEVIENDSDASVRAAALQRIQSLDLLALLTEKPLPEPIHQEVMARLQQFVRKEDAAAASLLQWIQNQQQTAFKLLGLEFLISKAAALEVRQYLFDSQEISPDLLIQIALNDNHTELRQQALQRLLALQNAYWIEKLVKGSGRDKRIQRSAQEALQQMKKADSLQQKVNELCQQYAVLARAEPLPAMSELSELDRLWSRLESTPDAAAEERREQARAVYIQRMGERNQDVKTRTTLHARLAELSSQITLENRSQISEELGEIRKQWQEVATAAERTLEEKFRNALKHAQELCAQVEQNHQRSEKLQAALAHGQQLLDQPMALTEKEVLQWQQRAIALPLPRTEHSFTQDINNLVHKLQQRIQRQSSQKTDEFGIANQYLQQLQTQLEENQLDAALSIRTKLNTALKSSIALSKEQLDRIYRQLRQLDSDINRLKGWRRWGAGQTRDQLIEQVEEAVQQAFVNRDSMTQLQEFRSQWKKLNEQGAGSEAQWQRFNTACQAFHALIREQGKEQKEQWKAHRQLADTLILQMKEEIAQLDFSAPDWRLVEKYRQDLIQRWRTKPMLGFQDRKIMEKEFQQVLDLVDQPLTKVRKTEVLRREKLIKRLQEATGLAANEAASMARQLQRDWKSAIPLRRHDEERLWRQFRTLCDGVFERLQQEHEAHDSERQQNVQAKEAICAQLEAGHGGTLEQLQQLLTESYAQWDEVGPTPRESHRALSLRYQKVQQALRQEIAVQEYARAQESLQQLEQVISALREAEKAALAGAAVVPALELNGLTEDAVSEVQQRLQQLQSIVDNDEQALVALQTQDAKAQGMIQHLCAQAEVMAKIEPLAINDQERMELYVERLNAGFAGEVAESAIEETLAIQKNWLLHLPATDLPAELEQRFRLALEEIVRGANNEGNL